MSAIASSLTVTSGSESNEQHSIGRSLVLHILPGVFILTLFLATAPLLMRAGFPPMLAIVIGAAFGLAYQVGHLYNLGKKRNGKVSLKGIVLYRQSMPAWQYFVLIPLFVILAFLIDGLTKPVGMAMLSTLPWLPEWFPLQLARMAAAPSASLLLYVGVSA